MATLPQTATSVSLFTPFVLRGVTLRHRIVVSPMCQYSSEDGFASNWHLVHLGSRAVGGAAQVTVEMTAVSPEGRITPYCLGIWKDEHIPKLSEIAHFIEAQGAVPAIQIAHAGRKASCRRPGEGGTFLPESDGGWLPVAPSPIPFRPADGIPRELTGDEIGGIIDAFAAAARRAVKAGFKLIEIHGAHGYLLNEFMTPLANQRTDQYGGSFENRIRLTLETIRAIRSVIPAEMPLSMKISAVDWADGGWTIDDSVVLAKEAKNAGVDLIVCSSGNVVAHQKLEFTPGFQVPFADQVKRRAAIPTGAVGLITQPSQANEIIQSEKADLIVMAREFLRNPYFPLHAAKSLGAKVPFPRQYTPAYV
ncbi:MAG: oxidoreductase [Terriglobia bacterium]|nr:MAG: oxidoreductase [Terriglobia bacterium]